MHALLMKYMNALETPIELVKCGTSAYKRVCMQQSTIEWRIKNDNITTVSFHFFFFFFHMFVFFHILFRFDMHVNEIHPVNVSVCVCAHSRAHEYKCLLFLLSFYLCIKHAKSKCFPYYTFIFIQNTF